MQQDKQQQERNNTTSQFALEVNRQGSASNESTHQHQSSHNLYLQTILLLHKARNYSQDKQCLPELI